MTGPLTPTPLELVLTLAFAALACVVTAALVRARATADLAVARAERDTLAARMDDLAAREDERHETAALLLPVREAVGRMERQVGILERDRMEQFGALGERLAEVTASTAALGAHTSTLAGALNASNVRGAWGEVQLRRVLEHAGMLARCDFDEQVSAVTAHETKVRPDVVVRLPGDRVVVVDAKAPMSAFLSAQRADLDASTREETLRRHAAALRGHVESLAGKAYWTAFSQTPQMVVCFVPSEAVLSAALLADPALYDDALAHRVVLASPGTLLALLRTVAFTWQQEAVTANARQVLDLSRELYTRLATTGAHLSRMGGSLRRTVETYNALVGTLESRVLVTARRMQEFGLTEPAVPESAPVETAPRPLTAAELLDAVAADEARPELLLPEAVDEPRPRRAARTRPA